MLQRYPQHHRTWGLCLSETTYEPRLQDTTAAVEQYLTFNRTLPNSTHPICARRNHNNRISSCSDNIPLPIEQHPFMCVTLGKWLSRRPLLPALRISTPLSSKLPATTKQESSNLSSYTVIQPKDHKNCPTVPYTDRSWLQQNAPLQWWHGLPHIKSVTHIFSQPNVWKLVTVERIVRRSDVFLWINVKKTTTGAG